MSGNIGNIFTPLYESIFVRLSLISGNNRSQRRRIGTVIYCNFTYFYSVAQNLFVKESYDILLNLSQINGGIRYFSRNDSLLYVNGFKNIAFRDKRIFYQSPTFKGIIVLNVVCHRHYVRRARIIFVSDFLRSDHFSVIDKLDKILSYRVRIKRVDGHIA